MDQRFIKLCCDMLFPSIIHRHVIVLTNCINLIKISAFEVFLPAHDIVGSNWLISIVQKHRHRNEFIRSLTKNIKIFKPNKTVVVYLNRIDVHYHGVGDQYQSADKFVWLSMPRQNGDCRTLTSKGNICICQYAIKATIREK